MNFMDVTEEDGILWIIKQHFSKMENFLVQPISCLDICRKIAEANLSPDECMFINGGVLFICLVQGTSKRLSTLMKFLERTHENNTNYHGDFEKDAIAVNSLVQSNVNNLGTNVNHRYVVHGAHALKYLKQGGTQALHIDVGKRNKACIQAVTNKTKPTHVVKVPDFVSEAMSLRGLVHLVDEQNSMVHFKDLYPRISDFLKSLDETAMCRINNALEMYAPLLALPLLWGDVKIYCEDSKTSIDNSNGLQ